MALAKTPSDAQYYSPLSQSESEDLHPLLIDEPISRRPSQRWGWTCFISASVLAILLSALNLTLASSSKAYHVYTNPVKTPSVYMGLDRLSGNAACRSRVTFPKAFGVFTGDAIGDMTDVHAPDDNITLSFGEEVSAYADIYLPDYNLQNCTITVSRRTSPASDSPEDAVPFEVEIWHLPTPGSLAGRTFIDTVLYSPGVESTTRPFFCPSRTHMYFQWVCPTAGCRVQFPLEGVTSLTASAVSLSKTGFRLAQYEALHCIKTH